MTFKSRYLPVCLLELDVNRSLHLAMATEWVRVRYPRVSGLADLDSGMISHLRFSGSGSGLVFHCGYQMDNCFE